jgi:argininosuccinate lyase
VALTTVVKGLVLAYGSDLQEDKERVFDAADTLEPCLAIMAGMIADLTVNPARMRELANAGYPTATDLADWLVREAGLPFREAHHITGAIVKRAEELGIDLDHLPLEEMQNIAPAITADVHKVLSVEASVASRMSYGGTAPDRVREQIFFWKEKLK